MRERQGLALGVEALVGMARVGDAFHCAIRFAACSIGFKYPHECALSA